MSQAPQRDCLLRLLFGQHSVRGAAVSIDEGVAAMLPPQRYPDPVRRLLGEALAAVALIGANLKDPGRVALQFQGGRHLPLAVAQADHEGKLRAMARLADGAGELPADYRALVEGARLAVLIEPRDGPRYQGMVEIAGDRLAQSLEGYFARSEQLPTRIVLAASDDRLAGILLQQMPGQEGTDEGLAHLGVLLDTLGPDELLANPPERILHRLFHAEDLRLLACHPLRLRCRCDHATTSRLLVALGREEIEPLLAERGEVRLKCEFCGAEYVYDAAEVETLFAASESPDEPGSASRH